MNSLKKIKHLLFAYFANFYNNYPSKNLKLIGVTGTDGKTTTTLMIHHILKKKGYKVGYISTVGINIGNDESENEFHVTTPSSTNLQKILKKAVENKLEYIILEVSSHALEQYRVWGCEFEVGVVTNVTDEHLDYHKNYLSYLSSKAKLFKQSKIAVLNKDDKSYKYLKNIKTKRIVYSNKDLNKYKFRLNSNKKYNYMNALAAVNASKLVGVDIKRAMKHLESFSFPKGRDEVIQEKPFKIVVDFAHTSNGLNKFFESMEKPKGKVIHVFGCAGLRDAYKRESMGEISAKYSDVIILTSEDPRTEPLEKINSQIKKGIEKAKGKIKLLEINDRQLAILEAIKLAKARDLVLITGKGHEKSNNINGIEYPWDEYQAIKNALKKSFSLKLPKNTLDLIDRYINLKIANREIRTPYYQNYLAKKKNKVYVGKGLPEEIELATKLNMKKLGKNANNISTENLRYFMLMCDIGIDCSGFVKNVLENYLDQISAPSLKKLLKPKKGIINYLRHNLRYSTNLSADLFTNEANTQKIELKNSLPGDLIRFGPKHVGIITEVHYRNKKLEKITFAHSTTDYFEKSGVRKENIIINNIEKPLENQKWQEILKGKEFSKMDYLKADKNNRGIRRLNIFK